MPRELRPFAIIATLVVAAAAVLDLVNGRFWASDFRVYWGAADALLHGRPVYGVAFGEDTGFYKYAPVVVMAFIPAALLPFRLAAVVHVLLIAVPLVLSTTRMERLLMRHVHLVHPPRILLRAVLGLLCIAVLLARELHLGNVNLWLVWLTIVFMDHLLDDQALGAGLCLGLLVLIKPYLLLLGVPILVRRQWTVVLMAATVGLGGLLIPFIVLGPTHALSLHEAWWYAMAAHGSYLTSPDTLLALGSRYLGAPSGPHAGLWVIAATAIALGAWTAVHQRRSSPPAGQARQRLLEESVALALVPLVVITDQEHFLFALPLILLCLGDLYQGRDHLMALLFVLAMFLYGTRSSDLWGGPLEDALSAAGALGLGELCLVCISLALSWRRRA